jgi:hypothetical protein
MPKDPRPKKNPNQQRGGRTPPARGGRQWCQDCDREIERKLGRWVARATGSASCSHGAGGKHHPGA